jgi:hypothetical protein
MDVKIAGEKVSPWRRHYSWLRRQNGKPSTISRPGYCPARCVMTGLVAPEQGHRLNVHLELCNKARYDFHARITQDDARDTLALAREFIAFLEAQLREVEG